MSITARRTTAIAVLLVLVACTGNDSGTPATDIIEGSRPNVVVIVIDDLRWDEFGASGHPYLETPNIDRLAQEGAMFVNSFHAVPLCSPNRPAY